MAIHSVSNTCFADTLTVDGNKYKTLKFKLLLVRSGIDPLYKYNNTPAQIWLQHEE